MRSTAPNAQREADRERRVIRQIYWGAFATRAIAGILAYVATEYLGMRILEDALYYEDMGYYVASEWLSGSSLSLTDMLGFHGSFGAVLIVLIAILYYVMEGVRAVPILLLVYSAITAFVPVYTYRLARELGLSPSGAKAAAWLIALSPGFAFWSGALHKEGLTLLILSVMTYHVLRLQSRWRIRSFVLVAASILALWGLRYYLAVLMAAVVTLGLLWGNRNPAKTGGTLGALAFARHAVVAAGFVALMFGVGFVERSESMLVEDERGILLQLDRTRQWGATAADSGYLPDIRITTPAEAAEYFPVGFLYFLFVPFPWAFGSIRQNAAIPETLFWAAVYPLVAVGIIRGLRMNRAGTLVLLGASVGMCVFYALLSGNVGTAYRMRSQVWLLWAPFAAWGWEVWQERRRRLSAAATRAKNPQRPVPARPMAR
jgi:hypothetical protein